MIAFKKNMKIKNVSNTRKKHTGNITDFFLFVLIANILEILLTMRELKYPITIVLNVVTE